MTKELILVFMLFGELIARVNENKIDSLDIFKPKYRRKTLSAEALASLNLVLKTCTEESDLKAIPSHPMLKTKRSRSILDGSMPSCSPLDSCKSRCGDTPRGLPFTCNCDFKCATFQDCCADFESHCNATVGSLAIDEVITKPTCRNLLPFPPWNVFVITKCLPSYNDNLKRALCDVDLPKGCVISRLLEGDPQEVMLKKCNETSFKECKAMFQHCDETVEPHCIAIVNKECQRRSRLHCQKCGDNFWPVMSNDGLLYKNAHCAACNDETNYSRVALENLFANFLRNKNQTILRSCIPTIDNCPPQNFNQHHLASLCSQFNSPVLSSHILYKNVYCGLCNGVEQDEMMCPDFSMRINGNVPMFYSFFNLDMMDDDITMDVLGSKVDDLPAAFSILLNFGLDGRERMLFSSEGEDEMRRHQILCGSGFIWDPFSKICRKLFCSTEFVLENYRCVKKENNNPSEENANDTFVIPDTNSDFVHLSLSAEVDLLDFLQFHNHDDGNITESIRESLALSFNISQDRIQNVHYNISNWNETLRMLQEDMDDTHPIIFIIDFDLYEKLEDQIPEPTVDSIVSMLASALSVEGFEFDVSNVRGRIFEIHQTSDVLHTWCDPALQVEYWNSDFSLIMDEESKGGSRISGVYVNKTGKFYGKGKFVANILFQGYQFNDHLINVSGLVIVCNQKNKLNSSCTRVILEKNEYTILENGTLIVQNMSQNNKVLDNTSYEESDNGTILVCLMSLMNDDWEEKYYLEFDIVQAYVSVILLYISVIALAAVLTTYCLFSNLRNLPGCNTMNLTFSLLVMQVTFLIGQRNTVTGDWCKGVAHFFHYDLLCSFTWMNVMAFDLYKTFGSGSIISNMRSKSKHLPRYVAYAYGTPLIVVLVTFLLDRFAEGSDFAPHYGFNDICWITSKTAAITFFASPLAIIMVVNFLFYVLTIRAIRNVKHESHLSDQKRRKHGHSDVFLYARMALVTGLTWALAFAAAYVRADDTRGQILTYLFIIFNTLQGLFLFFVFMCNRRVCELYRTLFKQCFCGEKSKMVIGTVSRVANVMKRSISTDTVISTISSSSTGSDSSTLKTIRE